MKRRIVSIIAVILVVAMLSVVLVACFGADSYVSKLHKEGYEYVDTETDEDVLNRVLDNDEWEYGEIAWTLYAREDPDDYESDTVTIYSFKDKKDAEDYFDYMEELLEDVDDVKVIIKGKDVISGTKKGVKIFE